MKEEAQSKSNKIADKIMMFAAKVGEQRHLLAIRDGISTSMPLLIVGSIFLLIANMPIKGYEEFMKSHFGENIITKLQYPVDGTFNLLGLVSVFAIAYYLAKQYKIDGISSGFIALSCFALSTPLTEDGNISMKQMGSQGLFVAIIVAIVTTEIYRIFLKKNITIKLPSTVPPAVAKSFVALIPCLACVTLFWVIRLILEGAGLGSLHQIVTTVIGIPLKRVGGGYFGGLVNVMLISLFWTVGIHGAQVVNSVMSPIWLQQLDENRMAFQAGQELPNILTTTFWDTMWIGGSGVLLGLAILLAFRAKSSQLKEVGKTGFASTIFTINEPIMFGLPVILNPIILIPYCLMPIIAYNMTYWSMYFGLVPKTTGVSLPWTTPPLVQGYLATNGSFSAVILQLLIIIVSVLVYYPFFKYLDKVTLKKEEEIALQSNE